MKDITVDDILREMLQEPEFKGTPYRILKYTTVRSMRRIFHLMRKPDRCIAIKRYPFAVIREMGMGDEILAEWMDVDETKYLSRDIREKMESTRDYYKYIITQSDGKKRTVFFKWDNKRRVYIQTKRYNRHKKRMEAGQQNSKTINT